MRRPHKIKFDPIRPAPYSDAEALFGVLAFFAAMAFACGAVGFAVWVVIKVIL